MSIDQVVQQLSTAASELVDLRLFRSGFIGPVIPQRPKKSSRNQWLAPQNPTDLSRSCGVSGWGGAVDITLYLMTSAAPELLFKAAFICFGLQGLFAWLLRGRVEDDEPLLRALFANPITQGQREPGHFLRVRFFWPFASVPPELSDCAPLTVALFWMVRLAGFGFALSIAAFFASMFVIAGA